MLGQKNQSGQESPKSMQEEEKIEINKNLMDHFTMKNLGLGFTKILFVCDFIGKPITIAVHCLKIIQIPYIQNMNTKQKVQITYLELHKGAI